MELILPEGAEGRQALVEVYESYLGLLGRPPDKIGLAHCCQHLGRGSSVLEIRQGILGSDEFRQRTGGSPERVEDASRSRATGMDVLAILFDGAVPVSNRTAYRWWLDETHEGRRQAADRDRSASGDGHVTFILPLAGGDAGEALRTVASVLEQHDPRWRMIVLAGTPAIGRAVREAASDDRIRVVGGPSMVASARLRRALRGSEAAMTCLLGQGDRVADLAVGEILSLRDADIVLSDGDVLDRDGRSHSPVLTAGWDVERAPIREPAGLVAIRASLLRKAWRTSWLGAGSEPRWEALLRAAAEVPAGRIRHVPALLLHRPRSARRSRPERPVVTAFLHGVGQAPSADLMEQEAGGLRVVHPLPERLPLVSVIVPTRDQPGLLRNCAAGVLERTDYGPVELVVVDNGSASAAARDMLAELGRDPRVTVVEETIAFHWGKLNAAGIRASRGEIVVLLNDDIDVIDPGWLRELVSQALRPDVGLVGAKLLYPSGGVQHAGIVLDHREAIHVWRHAPGDHAGYDGQLASPRTVSAVTGACVAMTRKVYDEIEGFESDHLAVTWGDIDLCFRVRRRGYRVVWTPHAVLHHIEQATRGPDTTPETQRRIDRERAYMQAEWGPWIEEDPYFSPNLNATTAGPTLRTREAG